MLGAARRPPPWVRDVWAQIAFLLDPVMEGLSGSPAVRSLQLTAPPAVSAAQLRFGRLGWNEASAAKWTHVEDGRLASGTPAFFLSADVWAPSWTQAERARKPPDVFFALANQKHLAGRAKAAPDEGFDNVCLLAVAHDLSPLTRRLADQARLGVAELLAAPLCAHTRRRWREPASTPGVRRNEIGDLAITGLFKPGPRHGFAPELGMLEGEWRAR